MVVQFPPCVHLCEEVPGGNSSYSSNNFSNVERYSFVSFGANRQNKISIMFNFVVHLLQNNERRKQTLDEGNVFDEPS